MAIYEEKFLVINWKRMDELNSGYYKGSFFPLEDCPPVVKFKKALAEFIKHYANNTGNKLDQKYYVCNQDEDYAKRVVDIIIEAENEKEVSR